MHDPYTVLGVSPGATQEEIKRAYRKKAKECHPDMHPDDPLATQKMNEVNEAYDMLMHPEKYRGQSSPFSGQTAHEQGQPFHTYTWSGESPFEQPDMDMFWGMPFFTTTAPPQMEMSDAPLVRDAIRSMEQQRYHEAVDILARIPQEARNARWHYLMACAHEGSGNIPSARFEIDQAIAMDPHHLVYRQAQERMSGASRTYRQRSTGAGGQIVSPGRILGSLCLSSLLFRWFCCC
ncbi:MAG: DnaJ domain-containing protein [Clostridia bacterium]|nr:DnaJ domain-containing protein [Clostridia bacterium]